jgi:transcriptional regulator GlxA family with amidase domain
MKTRRVGLLGFDGVMALDLVGPIDAFSSAMIEGSSGSNGTPRPCYEIVIIGLDKKPFVSQSGILFKPHTTLRAAPALDTLVIPGGPGLRDPKTQAIIAEWVKTRAGKIRRVASVCTGIYGLAPTGLLDGRCVATHWRYARDVARQFPKLKVDPDILFCQDGRFHTCAGVTSGIDLSLALIEDDCGPSVALAVARELVVYLKRAGGQEQYSEPLKFQTRSRDRFGDLAAWMQGPSGARPVGRDAGASSPPLSAAFQPPVQGCVRRPAGSIRRGPPPGSSSRASVRGQPNRRFGRAVSRVQ